MKLNKNFPILALVAVVMLALSSCNLLPPKISIEGRLATFAGDLSTNRNNAYANFAVGSVGYLTGTAVFNSAVFPAGTYTITGINSSNAAAVTATIYGPSTWSAGYQVTFNMVTNVTGDYVIQTMTIAALSLTI